MKFRVTGLALAGLMAASLVLPAFAATAQDASAEQTSSSGIYLDGELAQMLEYRLYKSVNYITVESFMAMMDEEAVVEEENGTVVVNATTVTGIVDVEDPDEEAEEQPDQEAQAQFEETLEAAQAEGQETAGQSEDAADGDPEAEESLQANVVEETLTLSASEGAQYVVANGRYLYVKNGVLELDGKIAVPVRVLAEIFNLEVGYDGKTGNVTLTSQEGAGAYLESGDAYYDSDTLYWLSRIIYAESGNQPLDGKIAVGNVVMNRMDSPLFPDTIYDVLFQRNQFSPAATGSIYRTPNAASVAAAKLVMDGAVSLKNVLFFNAAGLNSYASRNRPYVATIGAHAFYA